MNKRTKLLILCLGLTLGIYLVGKLVDYIALNYFDFTTTSMIVVIFRSVAAVVAVIALGGKSWLGFSWKSVRETWGFALPLIIINLLLGVSIACSVLLGLMQETIALETFITYGAFATVLCLFIGINEEVMFRGLVLGGLLAKDGDSAQGVLRAALISSLIFGAFHVVFSMNFTNIYSIGSGVMKTIETAMFAFILCVPVIREKKLWGAILAHGFFDWILLCGNTIQNGGLPEITYTSEDPTIAMATMGIFAVMCVLYLPFCIRAYMKLKEADAPQFGPFITEEEALAESN